MIGIFITSIVLFVLVVLYYNVSTNPNFFKITKKEKPEKDKQVQHDYIDPDLIPKKINIKKSKETNFEQTEEAVEEISKNTTNEPKVSEQPKEEIKENTFDKDEDLFDENMFTQDFSDDLMFGLDMDESSEFLEDFSNLSPRMKTLLITDIFKRKDW